MKKIKVIIVGAGSHALVIADIIINIDGYELIGFLEKDDIFDTLSVKTKKVTRNMSFPILPEREIFQSPLEDRAKSLILGIGQNFIRRREKLIKKFQKENYSFCSVIHSNSIIATSATIGKGVAVMAGSIINPFTRIKNHVVINTGAVVDHDCMIGDNTFIQPGAHLAGKVNIGRNTIIGIGANVKEGVCIGSNTIVGGGAYVNRNIPDNVVYTGVPAKKLKDNLREGGC